MTKHCQLSPMYSNHCQCHSKKCYNEEHPYINNIIQQCRGKCQYFGYTATPNTLQEISAYAFLSSPRLEHYLVKYSRKYSKKWKELRSLLGMKHDDNCRGHYVSKYICICTLCKMKKKTECIKNCLCSSCHICKGIGFCYNWICPNGLATWSTNALPTWFNI